MLLLWLLPGSLTLQLSSTVEPLFAKMSGAPSIETEGTANKQIKSQFLSPTLSPFFRWLS